MSVTVARDVTEHVKPPRAVFVPFRMGHHFGVPFHVDAQRTIITSALSLIESATHSGQIVDLALKWGDLRREAAEMERRHTMG